MKDSKQLPAQQENGEQDNENRHQFPEGEPAAIWFETPRGQAQDIQRRESENNRPENVVNIVAAMGCRSTSSNAAITPDGTGTAPNLQRAAYLALTILARTMAAVELEGEGITIAPDAMDGYYIFSMRRSRGQNLTTQNLQGRAERSYNSRIWWSRQSGRIDS